MSHCILWMDQSLAKKFTFSKSDYVVDEIVHKPKPERHDNHLDRIDQIQKQDQKEFFKSVAEKLTGADEILITGPGLAKKIFRKYLTDHRPDLAKKIIGELVMDHPSDARIVKSAKEYFKAAHIPI